MEWLQVFLLSAVPLIEMKGAIPLGINYYHINPIAVFLISFLGSLLPVPFVLISFNNNIFKGILSINIQFLKKGCLIQEHEEWVTIYQEIFCRVV